MRKQSIVHRTLGKEFSDIIATWIDTKTEQINASHDAEGKESIAGFKDLYYLDYMADLIEALADKAEAMVNEF